MRVSISKAAVAGLLGGVIGGLAMDQFTRAWNRFVPDTKHDRRPPLPYSRQEWDSTSRTARLSSQYVLGRELTFAETKVGAEIVHFLVGGTGGALYGALLGRRGRNPVFAGAAFGFVLWLVGEEVAMSVLGINDPPQSYSIAMHANSLGEHLAYGIATGLISTALLAIP